MKKDFGSAISAYPMYSTITHFPDQKLQKPPMQLFQNWIQNQRVAYHKHDGYVEHPVAVKHHDEYFDSGAHQKDAVQSTSMLNIDAPEFVKVSSVLAKHGKPYLVGGSVRDAILGKPVKDFDIEVFGIPADKLAEIVSSELGGKAEQVGKSFGVFKIGNVDISLPRTEVKTGEKHTDFTVTSDPNMTEKDAARRRDFTINALMLSPEKKLLDFFGGVEDLKAGIIRHIDDKTFVEDPLRVYRAAQFAARFGFKIAPETVELAKHMDLSSLPKERVYEEFKKLFLKSENPSIGLQALDDMGVLDRYFPEIAVLKHTPQRGDFHAEGNVFTHVKMVLDKAAVIASNISDETDKMAFMLSAVAHDLGKPAATKIDSGKITQYDHEKIGVDIAKQFLDRLTQESDVVDKVLLIVENHSLPTQFYRSQAPDSAFRRAINKHGVDNLRLLGMFSEADTTGRLHLLPDGQKAEAKRDESQWFLSRLNDVSTKQGITSRGKIVPLVTGDDLLALGIPKSPRIGQILRDVAARQEDGDLVDKGAALKYVQDTYLKKSVDALSLWLAKQKVAYHKHEGYPEHPVAVKNHEEFFQGYTAPTEQEEIDEADLEAIPPELKSYREDMLPVLYETVAGLRKMFPQSSVGFRVKSLMSMAEKLRRKNYSVEKMTDVAGTRITFDSVRDVYAAVQQIKRRFQVTEEEDYIQQPKDGYYRSFHMLLNMSGKPVELQLRTPCQTKIADWAHDRVYKQANAFREHVGELTQYLKQLSDWCAGLSQQKPAPPDNIKRIVGESIV